MNMIWFFITVGKIYEKVKNEVFKLTNGIVKTKLWVAIGWRQLLLLEFSASADKLKNIFMEVMVFSHLLGIVIIMLKMKYKWSYKALE